MTDFKIAVIGGGGGMGAWFARFLESRGFTVRIIDRGDSIGAVSGCRVAVVAVPIEATRSAIESVGPLLGPEDLLMDLTSLKEEPVKWMCASTKAEVLGCHPLFGPSVESPAGLKIVLCPARIEVWSKWPRELFLAEGARVIETAPARHDRIMSVVQGLNHLNTMTMHAVLRDTGTAPEELREFSTPLFELKNTIIERVVKENPRLHAELVVKNPHIGEILSLYEEALSKMKDLIEEGDAGAFVDFLNKVPSSNL